MAIAGTPTGFYAQQGNFQAYLLWNIVAGATSYDIQRSIDGGVNYTSLATPTAANYLDTTVALGSQYFYKVASVNGSGTSTYTVPQSVIISGSSELSLQELRTRSQQRADRLNSNFVTLPEWNFFINQAMYELYDLLINAYSEYFEAPEISFACNGADYLYPLPDGQLSFTDSTTGQAVVAPAFYRLSGVDLSLNNANNSYVTINKYNLIDRNRFVYPNTASTIYGVFNLQYRLMGNNIRFTPNPSSGQIIRLLYIPRLPTLLQETDLSTLGYSGWLQYVIVRAAKYALDKEESDTSKLDEELIFLKGRIEESAINRDVGQPDTISDIRGNRDGDWRGGGSGGMMGW